MFMNLEMSDGATAIINPAHVTHVTPSDPAYAEDGSVVHFVSDRAIKVRLTVAELEPMLGAVAEIARSSVRESFMLR